MSDRKRRSSRSKARKPRTPPAGGKPHGRELVHELEHKRAHRKRKRSRLRDRLHRITAAIKRGGDRIKRVRDRLRKHRHHFSPRFGVDFAAGRPSGDSLRGAGVRFVCRYLSHDSWKNLTADEVSEYHGAGLAIVTVWESTGDRALSGRSAGVEDANAAEAQLKALGAPAGAVVYFATDWDVTPAQKPIVAAYLDGAVSVLGKKRVGIYGSYYVVAYCADQGSCSRFWQTYAWSGGLLHKAAQLYQYSNGHDLAGVSVDYDKALSREYGGW